MTTAEIIGIAMGLLEEKNQAKLRAILMEQDREYTREEGLADIDSLANDRIDKELADIDLLKASGLRGPDLKAMLILERGLMRAKNAPGEVGRMARLYICREIAEFEDEQTKRK